MSRGFKEIKKYFSRVVQTDARDDQPTFAYTVKVYNEKIDNVLEEAGKGEPLIAKTSISDGGVISHSSGLLSRFNVTQKRSYSTSRVRKVPQVSEDKNHLLLDKEKKSPNASKPLLGG